MKCYFVGGYVRDKLLNIPSKDIDIAVEASTFNEMKDYILSQGCKIYIERPEFGAIRANHPKYGGVDYTICRSDGFYSDGRRPDSITIGNIETDCARRDYTVNALAMDVETETIYDFHRGQDHLKIKLLRAVGKAEDRFKEDSLRMLRAIRFHVVKGFDLDHEIIMALQNKELASLLKNASMDRIREEINKCTKHDMNKTMRLLYNSALWDHIFRDNNWFKLTNESK